MFENYLSNREQRVVINGQESSWGKVTAGVPQGSVLGPLLFLIYINDITSQVQSSEVRLFADDTILYVIIDNPAQGVNSLNADLDRISQWASDWLVKFSPPKTKSLTISRKKQENPSPLISFDGTDVTEVDSHKHLGVIISNDLSWRDHIENMVSNASKSLDVLNALKFKLDRKTLERLYMAFIRPKLEYSSIVWDSCTSELRDLVEGVQYRAGKIITGAISRTSHELVNRETGWTSLAQRRQNQRLKVFCKMTNNEAPTYLCDEVPVIEHGHYNLRNESNRLVLLGQQAGISMAC